MEKNKEQSVPELRFKGFSDTWVQHKLGELAETFEYGLNAAATDYDGTNKYIRITDIDDNNREFRSDALTSPNCDLSSADNYRLKKGDILFARTGASVGKTYRYCDKDGLVYFAGYLIRARIKQCYDSEFVFQNTLTEKYNNFIKITSQRSGQPGVNAQEYSCYTLGVPQVEEQRKISTFLSTLDHTIELYRLKLEGFRKLKKLYLQQMFPQADESLPKVRFGGFKEPWEKVKLVDIGETYTGLTGKIKDDFGSGSARYITYMNVYSNILSDFIGVGKIEIDSNQNEVRYGDVFFTTSSETPEEVGMSSVWLFDVKNVYLNSFCFGFRPKIEISHLYVAFMLRSPFVRANIKLLAQGISRYNISKKKLVEMEVPLPSLEEQRVVGNFFANLEAQITNQACKVELLRQLKSVYLQKMLI